MRTKRHLWMLLPLVIMILLAVAALAEDLVMPILEDEPPHIHICSENGICPECEEAYDPDDENVTHILRSSTEYGSDEENHWFYCRCGKKQQVLPHKKDCDKEVCNACGADYDGDSVDHVAKRTEWESDGELHWRICDACERTADTGKHIRNDCRVKRCSVCSKAYDGDNVVHADDTWASDGSQHWLECGLCHEEHSEKEGHSNTSGYRTDDDNHYLDCDVCGKTYESGEHRTSDGSENGPCATCGKMLGTTDPNVTDEPDETDPPTVTDEPEKTDPPEETDEPDETDPPTVTDEPEKTDPPEVTDEPEKTDPPEVTDEPEKTDPPTVTDEPKETDPPTVTDEPEKTDPPEVTDEPEKTDPPEVTDEPEKTDPPEVTDEPEETETPAATDEPEETESPAVTDEPEETEIPAATDEPEETETPAATDEPEETASPAVTDEPEETASPETAPPPSDTDEPGETSTPDKTEEPVETDVPEETPPDDVTEAPVETDAPDVTEEPVTSDIPNSTDEPEQTPSPDEEVSPDPSETPEATELPAATATPGSTKRPGATVAPKASTDGSSFLSRFQSNSSAAANGDLFTDADETVTLTVDAGTEESGYEGSVLTVFATGSRADGVTISLSSRYETDGLLLFRAWQESITEIHKLRETTSFTSFVDLAQALVQALMPEITADDADAIIVAILQSGFDGTLADVDLSALALGEDIGGEIVGYLMQNGYEFFLVLRDEDVSLLVREIN